MSLDRLFSLEGRVALVTGGNGGLGLGMALGLAEAGAHIAVAARNTEKTATARGQIEATGVKALALTADISRESDIAGMVAQTIEVFGRLDILVNNAGMVVRKEPQDLTTEEWDQVLDVNLRAAFLAAKTAYPHMKRQGGGKIINIGSMFSIFGGGGSGAPYSASKGGLVQPARAAWCSCPRAWR